MPSTSTFQKKGEKIPTCEHPSEIFLTVQYVLYGKDEKTGRIEKKTSFEKGRKDIRFCVRPQEWQGPKPYQRQKRHNPPCKTNLFLIEMFEKGKITGETTT